MHGNTKQTVGPGFETEYFVKFFDENQKRVLLYLGNHTLQNVVPYNKMTVWTSRKFASRHVSI